MPAGQIRSEARGAHWVAWIEPSGDSQPTTDGIIVVGQTQAEAEAHAREWAARQPPTR